jgi:hypothetical protein
VKEIVKIPHLIARNYCKLAKGAYDLAVSQFNPHRSNSIGKIAIIGEQCTEDDRLDLTLELLQEKGMINHNRSVAIRPVVVRKESAPVPSQRAAAVLADAVMSRYIDIDVDISQLAGGVKTYSQIEQMIHDPHQDHIVVSPPFTAQRIFRIDQGLEAFGGGVIMANDGPGSGLYIEPLQDDGNFKL